MLRRVLLLVGFSAAALAGAASSLLAATPIWTTTTTTTTTRATTTPQPLPTATPIAATSTAASTVVLTGHGWGHGMGMGQWGAYGYALHGWTYEAILAHYYTQTTLGSDPARTLRVLLADGTRRVALGSDAAWRVVDAAGTTAPLPPGKLVLDPTLTVDGQTLVPPLTFVPGRAPLQVGAVAYRGKILVALVAKRLQVVNRVGTEAYLKGVVPSEVPSSWPLEALKAQAVAARSYAVASLSTIVTAANYDLFSDTRSQVYGGIPAENPVTSAAVDDTAHEVVLYDGVVATTYFSSSTGGRTVSAAEATGRPIPYLTSVSDPYDTYATNHNWGPVLFDAAAVANAVGLAGQLLALDLQRGPSKHVTKVTVVGDTSQVVVTGAALRSALGLRSSWFTVGWLALNPQPAPLRFGTAVTLTGVGRGVTGVTLDEKPAGGSWQPLATVVPDATGAFTAAVRPQVTTSYRLSSGDLHAGLVTVSVVPVVSAQPVFGGVEGTIRPALEGSPVQLQLQNGTAWMTVATGTADATGTFAVTLPTQPRPGSYRIRSAPGHGLSPGVSLPLAIS